MCGEDNWAIWRCIDCSLGYPLCRKCIRESHVQSPFHQIECWTGSYFRRAALWEVGSYILVKHHKGQSICNYLRFQINYLKNFQLQRDREEQEKIQNWKNIAAANASAYNIYEPNPMEDEARYNSEHIQYMNDLLKEQYNDGNDEENQDDDTGGEAEVEGFEAYLGPSRTNDNVDGDALHDADPGVDDFQAQSNTRPNVDALNNTYVRIMHTNGIHHLAMVNCSCRGQDQIPLDLVACRLLPSSFHRIRTLFSAQLLDYFRLCSLELKASAYQFNQLIRRLTLPLGQSSIVNLYHEFRRMSRVWRWMKKIKWAGYGHNGKNPRTPDPGSLANFCPTCPQPEKNLPTNWKEDPNRFVFGVTLLADGNFKADHVAQKSNNDVWLLDGGGMAPNREAYFSFLATAIEKYTVSRR